MADKKKSKKDAKKDAKKTTKDAMGGMVAEASAARPTTSKKTKDLEKSAKKAEKKVAKKIEKVAKKSAKKEKVAPVPKGFQTITAHLVVEGAAAAIAFYEKAFGAKVKSRMNAPDGKVMHSELQIGDCRVMLADDFPEMCGGKRRSPSALGGTPVGLHLYVKNADQWFERATAAGCTTVMPVTEMFWGDRYGKLVDPYGHEWSVATRVKNLTNKQMEKAAMAAFAAPATA